MPKPSFEALNEKEYKTKKSRLQTLVMRLQVHFVSLIRKLQRNETLIYSSTV